MKNTWLFIIFLFFSAINCKSSRSSKLDSFTDDYGTNSDTYKRCQKQEYKQLWEITKGNKKNLILGTNHLFAGVDLQEEIINKIMSYEQLAFETDIVPAFKKIGIPNESMDVVLSSNMDGYLYQLASDMQKSIIPLESVDDHVDIVQHLNTAYQQDVQNKISKDIKENIIYQNRTRILMRNASVGDIEGILQYYTEETNISPNFRKMVERDASWKQDIIRLLNKGNSAIIVGLFHVIGNHPTSIRNIAIEEGFEMKKFSLCNE